MPVQWRRLEMVGGQDVPPELLVVGFTHEDSLDESGAQITKFDFQQLFESGQHVILSFEKITALSSYGLGKLLIFKEQMTSCRLELFFCHVPVFLTEMIEKAGLKKFFDVRSTVEEAVAVLTPPPPTCRLAS